MTARWLTSLYESAPSLRPLMASLRGWNLNRQRYGKESPALVEQALQRDTWSADQWRDWQAKRLPFVLETAALHTPAYRAYWEARADAAAPAWRDLRNWPVLEKELLRRDPDQYLAEHQNARRLWVTHTSGSTGTPMRIWHSLRTQRDWYALFEARCRRWYGVSYRDRWAIMGGQIIKPVHEAVAPYWVWNAAMRQLYLSTYHLAPERVPAYLAAMSRYRVRYMVGYPSALNELACEVLRLGRTDVRLAVVITNAEPLLAQQRENIARAFGCPVRSSYGMTEYCAGASECEEGNLHLWPEAGVLEVCDANGDIRTSGAGDLIATSLLKLDMPLVRYRVGDHVRLASWDERCPCGRSLPLLGEVDGRSDDIVVTPAGVRVCRLDPVFKADVPIRESQIVQEAIDRFLVRYVPAEGFQPEHELEMAQHLQDYVGTVQVRFEAMARIPRSANGKLKSVVSLLK